MSITDELREWAEDRIPNAELAAIADRIDAEHEAMLGDARKHVYEGYVELPKDADGECIRIGDKLDGYGKTIEVVELRYGRSGWVLISRDGNGYADTYAFVHRKPTVEDVLREFAEKITDSQIPGVHPTYEESIAEYSAKFRLADDGDEQ